MKDWFESKVKYPKVTETGSEKIITENFLLDAVNYTEAEARITEEAGKMAKGFTIQDIRRSSVIEVFPFDDGEFWYKAKIQVVSIDEEAGREKRMSINSIVQADDLKEAEARLEESYAYLVVPYEVVALQKSNIVDVFPFFEEASDLM